jgi:hypothetical protein
VTLSSAPDEGVTDVNICRYPNEAALRRAKENVEKSFAVIGVTEDMLTFTKVLERVIPKYFKGLSTIYKSMESEWSRLYRSTCIFHFTDHSQSGLA